MQAVKRIIPRGIDDRASGHVRREHMTVKPSCEIYLRAEKFRFGQIGFWKVDRARAGLQKKAYGIIVSQYISISNVGGHGNFNLLSSAFL